MSPCFQITVNGLDCLSSRISFRSLRLTLERQVPCSRASSRHGLGSLLVPLGLKVTSPIGYLQGEAAREWRQWGRRAEMGISLPNPSVLPSSLPYPRGGPR